jgi:oligoendopeptidase F
MLNAEITKIQRQFLPENLVIEKFQSLEPYFEQLMDTEIQSKEDLEKWLNQVSELEAAISEDACWRQIKMTCDTTDPQLEAAYTFWCTDIQPQMSVQMDRINKKLMSSPYIHELDPSQYDIYLRNIKTAIELFQEKNIALQSEESVLAQQYGSIAGAMTIEVEGKTITMQQAAPYLMQSDRSLRKEVYEKIAARRLQDKDILNELFSKLLNLRHQIATNAGFNNYQAYKFKSLNRYDYTPEDCFQFHEAIKKYIMPLCDELYAQKKKLLMIDQLYPYDLDAEPIGRNALHPFADGEDLINKSIAVFDRLGLGDCFRKMKSIGHLDLDSRIGKAPGGYNCPLAETGVPFIFMNAAGTADDVVTMMHEGGHAVHSFLCHELTLNGFKEYPMEIAELASMSMELFTMDHWHLFYDNPDELKRAQTEELERVLTILPWIAVIDKFQHWIYTNPSHTNAERSTMWMQILKEFESPLIDYSAYESYREYFWQKQLHLFEVPFYYIEYGIAQLGAIAMWKQYKEGPEEAIQNYMSALKLGNTKGLKKLYAEAGIRFDFSESYVRELSEFVKGEVFFSE